MSIHMDSEAVNTLADDLAKVRSRVEPEVGKVVFKAASNIKRDWRANVGATAGRVRAYRYAIGHDASTSSLTATIEAQGPQAAFAAILEYGTATSPPHNDAKRALDKEAPKFEKYVLKAAQDVFK